MELDKLSNNNFFAESIYLSISFKSIILTQNIRIVACTPIIMCLQQKIPTGKRFQISKVGLRKVIHTQIRRRTHEKLRRI